MRSILIPKMFGDQFKSNKSARLYCKILDGCSEYTGNPHELVASVMGGFDKAAQGMREQSKKRLHGVVFEYVIGEVLLLKGIAPLYYQAMLRHVPMACFDWLLYHPKTPVSISCKTSARERWKQAAYEGMTLKRVYPQAVNYMISIEETSAVEKKKQEAPQTIDHYIDATEQSFDASISQIGTTEYSIAESVSPIIKGIALTNGAA